jgi:hypothetical protein
MTTHNEDGMRELHNEDVDAREADMPCLSLALSDRLALATMIRSFLLAMRQKPLPASDSETATCTAAFERLERLQKQLASDEHGRTLVLRLEDLYALHGALMLFSVYLILETPKSERRDLIVEALWEMRDHLRQVERQRFRLN